MQFLKDDVQTVDVLLKITLITSCFKVNKTIVLLKLIFMPQTLEGHIAFGLSVCQSVYLSVRLYVCYTFFL